MRAIRFMAVAALGAALLAPGVAAAQSPKFFRIGTGGAGGTYFPIGGIIATGISNPPGSRPCDKGGACGVPGLIAIVQSSDGSVGNINGVASGQMESGIAQSDVTHWAYTGTGLFEGKPKVDSLRVIANLFPEHIQVFTKGNSGITSIGQLKGKKVNYGPPASGTLVGARLFFEVYGLKEKTDLQPEYLNPQPAADRIRDGQLDAAFLIAGTPTAALVELASTVGMTLLPVGGADREKVLKAIPFWSETTVPAGTYKGIDKDVPTVAVGAWWVTNNKQPDDLIYEITKALWNKNTRELLDSGHAKGKSIVQAGATKGVSVPFHPGAEKFYKEAGLIK
ncbi:MAG: TAXI family TRAP transporter solute-binding subunit [Alphaproteobacteria bacterium]